MAQVTIKAGDFNAAIFHKYPIQKRKTGNNGGKGKGKTYLDMIAAFDIETTNLPELEQSVMYIWQLQLDDVTVIGRTWEEFTDLLTRISSYMKRGTYLVIFVHNLSFEFSFLKAWLDFSHVFCMDSRKVLKAECLKHFEFRCSYIHSNMSLSKYLENMGVPDQKLHNFDYKKRRFSDTELSDEELQYCINDVKGLVEAIKVEMEKDGDNLYTFPLTATGYVRRDAREALHSCTWLHSIQPDFHLYELLRYAFRGGNTHANRWTADNIIENVSSADISSSYPTVLVNCKYPVGEWQKAYRTDWDYYRLLTHINKAVLMVIEFEDLKLTDIFWGCPYLTKDKCYQTSKGHYDNGRILDCQFTRTVITDIDLEIIASEYSWSNANITEMYYSSYGYLPDSYRDLIKKYYKDKTELKGLEDQEYYYNKRKALLNSLYGLTAQNPLKPSIEFRDGDFIVAPPTEEDYNKIISKALLSYAWGVWCTCHARKRLEMGIRFVGVDNFVYCDTDSVYYTGTVDWDKFNAPLQKESEQTGFYASDKHGKIHYAGVYEFEKTTQQFKTLGAKKYAYIDKDGNMRITIAGVSKKIGARELQKNGGLEAFAPGFVFREAGGTESKYNDHIDFWTETDGRKVHITDNCYIADSTYTLGLTPEYAWLLEHCNMELAAYYMQKELNGPEPLSI